MKYIIVRHSAFGYDRDPRYERGLEVRKISKEEVERRFKDCGACIFDTFKEADTWATKEQFPHGKMSRTKQPHLPEAPGGFLRAKVDGLQVYVPAENLERSSTAATAGP